MGKNRAVREIISTPVNLQYRQTDSQLLAHMLIAILHLIRHLNPDYPAMVDGLRRRGHKVLLGNLNDQGNLSWHDGERIVHEHNGPNSVQVLDGRQKKRSLGDQRRLISEVSRYLQGVRPDVVQFEPESMMLAWYLAYSLPQSIAVIQDIKQTNVGIRRTLRATFRDWRRINSIKLRAHYLCDHTFFDYHYAAEAILGEDWQQISTVTPIGIDPSFLTISRPVQPPSNPGDPVRFCYVGTISRFRELDTLLRACNIMAETTRNFGVDFIGPDRAGGYYQDLIEQLNISDLVRILSPVAHHEIPTVLNSGYEVGLAFSPIRPTWHFQPTVKILEYRALGMPIISTDVRSHRDYVDEEINGLLVSNTPEEWAEAMLRFVRDRVFLNECYVHAMGMREANTVDEVVRIHEKTYVSLMEMKSRNG